MTIKWRGCDQNSTLPDLKLEAWLHACPGEGQIHSSQAHSHMPTCQSHAPGGLVLLYTHLLGLPTEFLSSYT